MLYLPENLKKYRILKNLTQEDVAEYLRITPQSVSKWERGESYPDITPVSYTHLDVYKRQPIIKIPLITLPAIIALIILLF